MAHCKWSMVKWEMRILPVPQLRPTSHSKFPLCPHRITEQLVWYFIGCSILYSDPYLAFQLKKYINCTVIIDVVYSCWLAFWWTQALLVKFFLLQLFLPYKWKLISAVQGWPHILRVSVSEQMMDYFFLEASSLLEVHLLPRFCTFLATKS